MTSPITVLASASPRRRELLKLLDLPFVVVRPEQPPGQPGHKPPPNGGVDETPLPGESPPNLVQRLSRTKARTVAARLPSLTLSAIKDRLDPQTIIIAADTVVVEQNEILGKPDSPAEAIQMLEQLRRAGYHYVYSGLTVAVGRDDEQPPEPSSLQTFRLITRLHQTKVWMRPYTDAEIKTYVASGDPLDKAGAYGIQHKTFAPVEHLEGCFASVMGLPLGELAATLKELGLTIPLVAPRCARYTGHPCCQQVS